LAKADGGLSGDTDQDGLKEDVQGQAACRSPRQPEDQKKRTIQSLTCLGIECSYNLSDPVATKSVQFIGHDLRANE
jgi:hypothetical protein